MERENLTGLLSSVFRRSPDPAYVWHCPPGAEPALVAVNSAAEALAGADAGTVLARAQAALDVPELRLRADLEECAREHAPVSREVTRSAPPGGVERRLLVSHTPVGDTVVLTLVRDVTGTWTALTAERERVSELLQLTELTHALLEADDPQQARETFCGAARSLADADAVFLAEPEGEQLVATARALVAGMPEPGRLVLPLGPGDRSVTGQAFHAATPRTAFVADLATDPTADRGLVRATGCVSGFFTSVSARNRVVGVLVVAWRAAQPTPPERVLRLMPLLAADAALVITRADLVAHLDDAAGSDPLTGLPNRRAADTALDQHLAHARRTGHPFSLAVLDVNGLKKVNDEQGHDAGDALLRHAAHAWRSALRREDLLARVGGDEFVLLMPDSTATDAARAVSRLRAAAPGVSVAAGVAQWHDDQSARDLLAAADARMYQDKQHM